MVEASNQEEGRARRVLSELVSLKNQQHLLESCRGSESEEVAQVVQEMLSYMSDDGKLLMDEPVTFQIPQSVLRFMRSLEIRGRERVYLVARQVH